MKKLLLLGVCVASAITLSACGSSRTKTIGQEVYIKTIDQVVSKEATNLAQCIEINLKEYQASSHMRPRTLEIWSGAVPSTDNNQPQATIEIAPPSYGEGGIHAHLNVFQRQPVVEEINEPIRPCL